MVSTAGSIEQIGQVLEGQAQPVGDDAGDHGERVMGGVESVRADQFDASQVGGAGQGVPVDRVGLEHGQRVESAARPGGVLDLGQPELMVVEQRRLLGLHPNEQLAQGFPVVQGDPHRHGVDEQPDHLLDAGHLPRPPRHGRAEHHVRAAGLRGQHDAPRDLHHRVRGDRPLPGQRGQRRGLPPRSIRGGSRRGTVGQLPRPRRRREQGRLVEPRQRADPRRPRRRGVALRQPGQVLPIRRAPASARRPPRHAAYPSSSSLISSGVDQPSSRMW